MVESTYLLHRGDKNSEYLIKMEEFIVPQQGFSCVLL